MNERTPLLPLVAAAPDQQMKADASSSDSTKADAEAGLRAQDDASPVTPPPDTTTTTTSTAAVSGEETDAVVTKQQNIPLLEFLALTAIISGSLSMYWGISGMLVGSTTAAAGAAVSVIMTTLISQPIIIVHVIMSTCVVVLAPVVTVQKGQLSALSTLREQQNELRSQINTFNQVNDELTKSISSIVDETDKLEKVNTELETYASSANTTTDRLIQLCTEQTETNSKILEHLQAKILQQIVTITLQSDRNQNYIVSESEVAVLIQRLQSIPGIMMNVDAFQNVLKQSEPVGSLTLTDICSIVRNMQANNNNTPSTTKTTIANDESVEVIPMGDPVFVFRPNDLLLLQK